MNANRRKWIKQSSLALAGLSILHEQAFSTPFRLTGNLPPDGVIKLNSNENPYGPSPLARKAMMDAVLQSNRYPWETTTKLIEKIASRYQLGAENVLMGAGSSEILGLVAQYAALLKSPLSGGTGNLVAAHPTFRIWMNAAEKFGLEVIKVPLSADKKHDLPAMAAKITAQTKLVYICNPNNPTGTIIDSNELKRFIDEVSKKTLVLLDEAYAEYADEPSPASLVAGNKNLVVARTFSKIYGLAGARIGYALAHGDTIKQLRSLQSWENAGASAVSLAGALASLDDSDFLQLSKAKNTTGKELLQATFKELNIPYIRSHANFLYYSVKNFSGDFIAKLTEQHILAGRIMEEENKWTRITIGTPDEMKKYTEVLKQIWQ